MIFFLDASALVKLYRDEAGSRAMRSLFESPEHKDAFFISDVVALEVLVRLAKLGRAGGREGRRDQRRLMAAYARHRTRFLNVVGTEPGVLESAESLAIEYDDSGAGTLDLLHAAFARQLQRTVAEEPLVFVVADRKLRSLVERIGFRTLDPEAPDPRS